MNALTTVKELRWSSRTDGWVWKSNKSHKKSFLLWLHGVCLSRPFLSRIVGLTSTVCQRQRLADQMLFRLLRRW